MDIKKIQYKLYNYYNMKDELEYIKTELAELEKLDGLRAVQFDKMPGIGSPSSIVESVVLIKEKERGLLNYKINSLTRQLNKIDDILDMMPDLHAQILKYRYIDKRTDKDVMKLVSLRSSEYKIKHKMSLEWFTRSYDAGFGLALDEDEAEQEKILLDEIECLQTSRGDL